MQTRFDVLIIGSGAAGLTAALALPRAFKIAVLSKGDVSGGATKWAQGGIAAVLDATDTIDSHIADTLVAGAGLCNEAAVRFICERGREAIQRLIDQGVAFTPAAPQEDGYGYHLTQEGGHSHRRIIHVADATGKAVQKTLEERVAEAPNIEVLERHMAVDLIGPRHLMRPGGAARCHGAYVLDLDSCHIQALPARSTILATGGASRVYVYTSNPDGATGDGIALAWRAGCRVANMEFNQFHPTCLYHPEAKTLLITEAVRGEGGVLKLADGERFMPRFDERAELAPRDIVARAIDHEMKRLGQPCVYLDISHKDPDFVIGHFPNIYRRLMRYGIDMTKQPIPVVPAAHYTCGGVLTDLAARTDLPGLYAIGECAHTGLHGANRMASNSLLECLVMGQAAADDIAASRDAAAQPPAIRPWDESRVTDSDEEIVVAHNWAELRRTMWNYVGIVRTDKRLARARRRVELLCEEIQDYYGNFRVTADLLELRNLTTVALLIVRSAQQRRESRGLHYTLNYPGLLDQAQETVLTPEPDEPRMTATA
ncbi:MAG: L-aspartate oxidase [Rhodothalassiaceae bacterium]